MVVRSRPGRRYGAVLVESAVVYPLLFLLLFGLIVGGLGVFRYQQVACQAREAARYACVHGADWQRETKQPCPTVAQIREDVVLPLAAGMDPSKLTVKLEWIDEITGTACDWDQASKWPAGTTQDRQRVSNRVRVTVTYEWWPEVLLAGPVNLKSVSEVPMAF
jgi:Flp pilus assembly protein TadG